MNVGVDRLCFGTSTFAAGRLYPRKDSQPGITTLRAAITAGVRLIHSNPKLDTQWAIRQALASVGEVEVRHMIKAEAPLDADVAAVQANVMGAIHASCETLDVGRLHAVTVEIDLKRTQDHQLLTVSQAVTTFYSTAATAALGSGHVSRVVAYCHSPAHLKAALEATDVCGIGAQYNVAEPWPALFLDSIERRGFEFVGMSPLRRGALAQVAAPRLAAVRWAAADPRVSAIVVTTSSSSHLQEVIGALREPLPASAVSQVACTWLKAAQSSPHSSPERISWSPLDRLRSYACRPQEGPRD